MNISIPDLLELAEEFESEGDYYGIAIGDFYRTLAGLKATGIPESSPGVMNAIDIFYSAVLGPVFPSRKARVSEMRRASSILERIFNPYADVL